MSRTAGTRLFPFSFLFFFFSFSFCFLFLFFLLLFSFSFLFPSIFFFFSFYCPFLFLFLILGAKNGVFFEASAKHMVQNGTSTIFTQNRPYWIANCHIS